MSRLAPVLVVFLVLVPLALGGPLEEGSSRIERYEFETARKILEPALAEDALEARALLLLTRSYNGTEDYKRGIEYGKRAVEALPESSEA